MKKIIMIAVLCTICLTMTACSGKKASSADSTDNPTTQSTTAASTEKETEKSTEIVTEKPTEALTERSTEALTERSTEIETEPKAVEYTAVELAGKSLNEIIEIMGGDYKADHLQLSNAFSSAGCPYIYNENKLPGFAFIAREGDTSYSGISIMNGAKLNDSISSDMTYNQIADIIGDMDGFLAGQEGNIMCRSSVDGYNVTFCFIENNYIRENKSGGQLPGALLREGNPELQSIGLRMN